MHDDAAAIMDMLLASRRLTSFVAGQDRLSFMAHEEKRWAVVSQIMVIGEAVRRLSSDFRSAHSGIPWDDIAGMRDRLIHGYDKINWDLVWVAATREVPDLMAYLQPLLPPAPPDTPRATTGS